MVELASVLTLQSRSRRNARAAMRQLHRRRVEARDARRTLDGVHRDAVHRDAVHRDDAAYPVEAPGPSGRKRPLPPEAT